jgi:putative serine protease PepD
MPDPYTGERTPQSPSDSSTRQPSDTQPYAGPPVGSTPPAQGSPAAGPPASGPAQPPHGGSSPRRWSDLLVVGVLSAVLASGGTYALTGGVGDEGPVVTGAGEVAEQEGGSSPASFTPAEDWGGVAEQVSPSVVAIEIATGSGGGSGSGVIWDDQGHVVTNAHVVAGAEQVRVTLADGRAYEAEVSGSDPATDLAVLTVTDAPEDLQPVEVGDDQALAVGSPVMAIGNPLGLSGTVTTGIVSALDRPVTTQSTEGGQPTAVVTNAIQTSAAINPGNSGGALVDASGRLVGINSAIASLSAPTGGQAGNIGIGFAIPMRSVSSIVEQLIETGTAEHAFLGVGLDDAEATLDGAVLTGAAVVQVEEGSPAASVGLAAGDLVIDIDGDRVSSAEALVAQVRERRAGEEAVVGVLRDGERQEFEVVLDTRPDVP